MAFSDETIKLAWQRAQGLCECSRISHPSHFMLKCNKILVWLNRGRESSLGSWETHHKDGNPDNDALSNCEILCWNCHSETF